MEQERFFSGYCRQLDSSRTVECIFENGALTEADCCYGTCIYQSTCPIGKEISSMAESSDGAS